MAIYLSRSDLGLFFPIAFIGEEACFTTKIHVVYLSGLHLSQPARTK